MEVETNDSIGKPPIYLESQEEESKSGFSSYLEEFLSAIKVFGYLDKPVFHELTRSMRTQRLDAGEVFSLDSSLGFSIVVEGSVNVYTKVSSDASINLNKLSNSENTYVLDGEKYQLINFVKTGNPLSSLASILSLFTEDENKNSQSKFLFSNFDQDSPISKIANNLLTSILEFDNRSGHDEFTSRSPSNESNINSSRIEIDLLPELIAKAKTDCTIAIIPEQAFKRLINKWPRAASHIVQVVLTRLYRITFQAAHKYFGLTDEIFKTEIKLNQETNCHLPQYLLDSLILKLKKKSKPESNNEESFLNPALNSTKSSLSITKFNSSSESSPKKTDSKDKYSRHVVLSSDSIHHPGDLLSNVPISRSAFNSSNSTAIALNTAGKNQEKMNKFSAKEETLDGALRIAVAENLFQFLGINESSINSPYLRSRSTSSVKCSRMDDNVLNNPQSKSLIQNNLNISFNNVTKHHLNSESSLSSNSTHNLYADEHLPKFDFYEAQKEFADGLQFIDYQAGELIIEQNTENLGLFYVISGALDISYTETSIYSNSKSNKDNKEENPNQQAPRELYLYTANNGCIAGYLASLVGHKSLVNVRAASHSYVAFLPQQTITRLCEKYFTIHLSIAKKMVKTLSKDVLDMDFAVEWVQARPGQAIYKQDMEATGIYLILSGRFRELIKKDVASDYEVLGEYGQGSSLGEVEVLTASKRKSSLIAVRESEAARIPRYLFEFLAFKNPAIMINISRLVASKVSDTNDMNMIPLNINPIAMDFNNYKTITILPSSYGLPVSEFADKLILQFKKMGNSVMALNQSSILNHLGKQVFDKLSNLRQSGYFSDLEEKYDLVIYVTDTPPSSNWTHTCISQGDCVLILADAESDPAVGEYESLLLKNKTTARAELVLLHPEKYVKPGSTHKWFAKRTWLSNHHHVQLSMSRVTADVASNKKFGSLFLTTLKTTVDNFTQDIVDKYVSLRKHRNSNQIYSKKNDFARLARILSGKAVGLVLGGGGARGLAHIGVIQTLEDMGIPIDLVGGTSIGAFVGGLYAKDYDVVSIYGRAKKFAGRTASLWRTIFDLTYPLVAYTTGHEFNRGVWKAFGDIRIEDFWVGFYCNSTNITNSVMEYHVSGYAWRYIRASMSLCGLVPPIIDNKGNMLLDGGYVDNLPVTEMLRQGASLVLAVDVGSVDDRTPMNYGDTLSGVLALINRYNPLSKNPIVPSMTDMQLRLAYVGSVGALERAKVTPGVVYLRPPIEKFGTLAFGCFDEVYEVGKKYAEGVLPILIENNKIPKSLIEEPKTDVKTRTPRQRRYSI